MAVKILARASITLAQTVDITGYYRYYKLQASTAAKPNKPTSIQTLPPSGWSETEPSYTENSTNSLYFVDLTIFSDNTFEYSDVSLSTSYEAAKQAYNKSVSVQNELNASRTWYAECTTAEATGDKVATVSPATTAFSLRTGTIVLVKFAHTNSDAVSDLTLNVNGTGAKHIKYIYNGSISDIPNKAYLKEGQTYQFYYDGTYWVVQMIYNTNTNTVGAYGGTSLAAGTNGIKQYSLIMKDSVGTWASLTTSSGTGTTKEKNPSGFIFDDIYYMSTSSNYAAGAKCGLCYDALSIDLRYSTNCDKTLTTGDPVYIKGEIHDDGLLYLDDVWYTQTEPTAEDGKTYVLAGIAYSTYQIYLLANNPAYQFYNGKFLKLSEIENIKRQEDLENLEIGGRNLIHNTNVIDVSKTSTRPNINGHYNDGSTDFGQIEFNSSNAILEAAEHGVRNKTTANSAAPWLRFGTNSNVEAYIPRTLGRYGLEQGKTYTLSFDLSTKMFSSGTSTARRRVGIYLYSGTEAAPNFALSTYEYVLDYPVADQGTEKSAHVEFTFTIPDDSTRIYFVCRGDQQTASWFATGDYLEMANIKLEEGNKATAWSPAPEDIDAQVEEAKKVADNYLAQDSTGVMVADLADGDQTPSTATGRNVLITNKDVQIRDGQVSIASFGEGTRVGKKDEVHMEVESDRMAGVGELGETFFEIDANGAEREGETLEYILLPWNQYATYGSPQTWHFALGTLGLTVGKSFKVSWGAGSAYRQYGLIQFTYGTSSTKNVTAEGVSVSVTYTYNATTGNSLKLTINTSSSSKFRLARIEITADYKTPTFRFGTSAGDRGAYSSSFGEGIINIDEDAMAVGRYNDPDIHNNLLGNPLFVVGNGSDEDHRSNAFRVHEHGSVFEGMLLTTGGYVNGGRVITSIRTVSANANSIAIGATANVTIDISDYDYTSPPIVIPYSTGWLTTVAPSSVSATSITGVVWNFSNGSHSGICQYLLIELNEVEE